jgi:hypothetical protein
MSMGVTLLVAALAAQTPQAEPRIEVAQANWGQFERVSSRLSVPTTRMIDQVERILRAGECRLPRQRPRDFNITLNYAMRLGADGRPERIVVQDIGCRPIETLVGGIVSDMVRHNYFNLPAAGEARWVGNSINFNLAS